MRTDLGEAGRGRAAFKSRVKQEGPSLLRRPWLETAVLRLLVVTTGCCWASLIRASLTRCVVVYVCVFCACRDALLRRLTLRFVLCRAALTLHTVAGRNPAHLPTVFPELPKEVRGERGRTGLVGSGGTVPRRALMQGRAGQGGEQQQVSQPRHALVGCVVGRSECLRRGVIVHHHAAHACPCQ